jgi:hypothetical protein
MVFIEGYVLFRSTIVSTAGQVGVIDIAMVHVRSVVDLWWRMAGHSIGSYASSVLRLAAPHLKRCNVYITGLVRYMDLFIGGVILNARTTHMTVCS